MEHWDEALGYYFRTHTHTHTHTHTQTSRHFLEVDELHFWCFQGQKELYVSLQSTGACGIPMQVCVYVVLVLLCAVREIVVCMRVHVCVLEWK